MDPVLRRHGDAVRLGRQPLTSGVGAVSGAGSRRSLPRSYQIALWLLAGLAGAAGLAILHVWVPAEGRENAVCLTRRLLGIPCPGCGLTRAFGHLAKGEWRAALVAHPLAPVVFLEIIAAWVAAGVALARRLPLRAPSWFEPVVVGHVAVLCALWVGRLATGTLPW